MTVQTPCRPVCTLSVQRADPLLRKIARTRKHLPVVGGAGPLTPLPPANRLACRWVITVRRERLAAEGKTTCASQSPSRTTPPRWAPEPIGSPLAHDPVG